MPHAVRRSVSAIVIQVCSSRFGRGHYRPLCPGRLRGRTAFVLGCWDHWVPGANKALDKLCNEWGDKKQSRCPNRLHHLARREGQAHRRGRSASRHRSRHHVASRLEHPHPSGGARAARRRRRRISSRNTARSARSPNISPRSKARGAAFRPRSAVRSNPAARASISTRSTPASICATCSRPTSRNTTRPRPTNGPGMLYRHRRRRSCTRPASRSACRWDRLPTRSTGSAGCSIPMASCSSTPRTTSRSIPTRRGRPWKWPARSWRSIRPRSTPGTTPATIAG